MFLLVGSLLSSGLFFVARKFANGFLLTTILGSIPLFFFTRILCFPGGWITHGYCGLPFGSLWGDFIFWVIISFVVNLFASFLDKFEVKATSAKVLLIVVVVLFWIISAFYLFQHQSLEFQVGKRNEERTRDIYYLQEYLTIYQEEFGHYPKTLEFDFDALPEDVFEQRGLSKPEATEKIFRDPLDPQYEYIYKVSEGGGSFLLAAYVEKEDSSWMMDKLSKSLHGVVLGVNCDEWTYCVGPIDH